MTTHNKHLYNAAINGLKQWKQASFKPTSCYETLQMAVYKHTTPLLYELHLHNQGLGNSLHRDIFQSLHTAKSIKLDDTRLDKGWKNSCVLLEVTYLILRLERLAKRHT